MTTARLATVCMAVMALGLALSTPLIFKGGKDFNGDKTDITIAGRDQGATATAEQETRDKITTSEVFTDKKPASNIGQPTQTALPREDLKKQEQPAGKEKVRKIEGSPSRSAQPASPALAMRADHEAQQGVRTGAMIQEMLSPPVDGFSDSYQDSGRDTFATINANPVKLVSESPVSTFSIDVDTASYGFVRRQLKNGVLPQKNAVRIEELINYFDYDYEIPSDRNVPFMPTVALYPTPWNQESQLLHIGIKGYDLVADQKPRSNLVFLLDVSGSMNSPDKLPLLKNSFAMLVEHLDRADTVAIVVYAGAAGTVLEPTKVQEKGKILAALDRLQAGGSTAGGEGIRLAYSLAEANFQKDAVNRVILATDGDFNVGIRDREELKSYIEKKRDTGVFLSILGFGQGNYNDALMQTLAQNGNGNAAYIDSLSEARKVLVDEAGSTLFPIAKDVKIQVEFNPATVKEYRLIGYETRLLKREDFNNDQVDAGDVGAGHRVTAIYEITPADGAAGRIDELRYQPQTTVTKKDTNSEYAFLKIRYKLPNEDKSRLLTKPIDVSMQYGKLQDVPVDIRFAATVAAFGQLLRNDPYTGGFGYDDVIEIGNGAKGQDRFGYRAEFLNLVRLAKTARAM